MLVVRNFLGSTQDHAFEVVNDLLTVRMRQFEHVVEQELPALVTDLSLDQKGQAALATYVRQLEDWVAAVHNWHRESRRYGSVEPRQGTAVAPPRIGTLTGLGTSAARVMSAR